jgi:putative glutamine amidotransferase
VGPGLSVLDGRPPLVGITTSELRRQDQNPPIKESEPPGTELALGLNYPAAVARAGGLPMVIPPLPALGVGAVIEHIDALLLSGGPDLHPRLYGQEPGPDLGPTEPELDAYELLLCRAALASRTPILGVCRGMQLINVACGGTLHQHVPASFGDAIEHRSPLKGVRASHTVTIVEGTCLAELAGGDELWVNSFHHQAIDELGQNLTIGARAPDGLIEGIEGTGDAFVVGVQWHLESLTATEPRQGALLSALVNAARRPRTGRRAAA